jgi:hypothetical protein
VGTVFKHVADSALGSGLGTACHHCEREDLPIYPYFGEIVNPELAHDPQLAREEPAVSELCAECIVGGNVRRDNHFEAESTIARFAADPDRAWKEFHQLPNLPLFLQRLDWPMCCGEWCEFTGIPGSYRDLLKIQDGCQGWNRGPGAPPRDFREGGAPASLREVSVFHCHECGSGYYTDQFT